MVDEALTFATHQVDAAVVLQRERLAADLNGQRDHDWMELHRATVADPADVARLDPHLLPYAQLCDGVLRLPGDTDWSFPVQTSLIIEFLSR